MVQAINNGHAVHEQLLAPNSDWSEMSEMEHFVQFYEADAFLLNSLGGYIGTALKAGEVAIVVATGVHREGLDALLQASGLDVTEAAASGKYISLDAAETLSKFMVDGSPEPGRFAEIVGGVIERAGSGGQRVRAFGEMVALLWAEGNYPAAIRLEELWNGLMSQTQSFSLYCAYQMNGFDGEELAGKLGDVCTTHSRVIPAESYAGLTTSDDRLRAIIALQQKAMLLEAEIAERKETEAALRAVKGELELQVKEREQLLRREQEARVEAERANRLKDEFLATVSHELRTPLNAIIGWSQMMRGGWLDEATTTRAVETIERNAKAQSEIINDILDVSRIITGNLRLDVRVVNLIPVIEAAIDAVRPSAEARGVKLQMLFDPSVNPVLADVERTQQVIWNLLTNAIKFTPKDGQVRVQVEQVDSFVQITVKDTGLGISAEFLPHVFDRFRQADASSTRKYGGLGLGLAIVRHLVEMQGGTASAESPGEGLGATFTVCLPVAAVEEKRDFSKSYAGLGGSYQAEDIDALAYCADLTGLQVLAIDDEEDARILLEAVLGQCGAEVKTAASSTAALELLQGWRPDVIISDLGMPEEDGYTFIRKVRALFVDEKDVIPAIALTAYARVEDRLRSLSSGYQNHLPKPIEPAELVAAVAGLVGRAGRVRHPCAGW